LITLNSGNAIQLENGRLLFAGHYGPYKFDLAWWSDDQGQTYKLGTDKLDKMDEIALVQLNNGSVMLNMRNDICHCRAVAISNDNGETFGPIHYDKTLISPVCQASIVRIDDTLFFSNPASSSKRANITVKRSFDQGNTWPTANETLVWEASGPGYSCLVDGGVTGVSGFDKKKGGILFERTVIIIIVKNPLS